MMGPFHPGPLPVPPREQGFSSGQVARLALILSSLLLMLMSLRPMLGTYPLRWLLLLQGLLLVALLLSEGLGQRPTRNVHIKRLLGASSWLLLSFGAWCALKLAMLGWAQHLLP